jgi:hypothetical protein
MRYSPQKSEIDLILDEMFEYFKKFLESNVGIWRSFTIRLGFGRKGSLVRRTDKNF